MASVKDLKKDIDVLMSLVLNDCFSVLEYNEKSGLRMAGEMSGHVAFSTYTDQGYTIITL